jgi:Ca2+-binding RTX toxin-like protein
MRRYWLRELARRVFGISRRGRGTVWYRRPADRQPVVEGLENRLLPASFAWVAGNGDWDTPTNWSRLGGGNGVPGASDTAIINNGLISVTHNFSTADNVQTLNVIGASLVVNNGSLTVGGGSLSNASVFNNATFIWTGTSNVTSGQGTVFTNNSAGQLLLRGTGTFMDNSLGGSGAKLIDIGTLNRDTGTGTATVGVEFAAGSANFNPSFSLSSVNFNGSVFVSSGTLQFTQNDDVQLVSTTFGNENALGGGAWSVNDATLDLGATISAVGIATYTTSLSVSGSTASVPGLSSLNEIGAFSTVLFDNNFQLTTTGALDNENGTLYLQSGASLTLAAGNDYTSDSTTNLAGGSLTVSGAGSVVNGGPLNGYGDVFGNVANSGGINPGSPGVSPAPVITIHGNLTGGYANLSVSGTAAGTFSQIAVTGTMTFNPGDPANIGISTSYIPSWGDSIPFLTAAGGVSGTYNDVNINGDRLAKDALSVQYSGTAVQLVANDFVVTTTADSGAGSLRAAITAANGKITPTSIVFNIPGSGVQTISPTSAEPTITGRTLLDGGSQSGYSPTAPLIVLDGSSAGAGADGIQVLAASSSVEGLVVDHFAVDGIALAGTGDFVGSDWVGVDSTGAAAAANGIGVEVLSGNTDTIGASAASGNVISGNTGAGVRVDNAPDTTVSGNLIGLNAAGTAAVANGSDGIKADTAGNNKLAVDDNTISGNAGYGIDVTGNASDLIQGNRIGTDPTGSIAVANHLGGVFLTGSVDSTLGGFLPGQGNLISGNGGDGVDLFNSSDFNAVEGNLIGTTADGSGALGNAGAGVKIFNSSQNNQIGTAGKDGIDDRLEANVISANQGAGNVVIDGDNNAGGQPTSGNIVAGNVIGLDDSALLTLSDPKTTAGVILTGGAQNNTIGVISSAADPAAMKNAISGNTGDGVDITNTGAVPSTGNLVAGNSIGLSRPGSQLVAGTVAWFPFDGNLTNVHPGGNNGTSQNGSLPTFGPGEVGEAATFSANQDQSIRVADYPAIEPVHALSIEAWINSLSPDPNEVGTVYLLAKGEDQFNNNSYALTAVFNPATGNEDLHFTIHTVSQAAAAAGATYTVSTSFGSPGGSPNPFDGAWHHVAGVYNGTTLFLYLDGVEVASAAADSSGIAYNLANPSLPSSSSNDITIGSNLDDSLFNLGYSGSIDELTIYSTALSPAAVQEIHGTAFQGKGNDGLGNAGNGVSVSADGNSIGGTTATARNLVSDNGGDGILIAANSTLVEGNYLGLHVAGLTNGVGNAGTGITITSGTGNSVGGTTAGAGNVISGNANEGVEIFSSNNLVAGNHIGTDADGQNAVLTGGSAQFEGVHLLGNGNTIGGTTAAARNVISGNASDGVLINGGGSNNVVEGNYVGTDVNGEGLLPGTVAWYTADASTKDVVGGHNGTLHGGVTFAAGEVDQAFDFLGNAGGYVDVPSSPALQPANAVSVDFWVKGSPPAGTSYLLAQGPANAAGASYAFYTLTGGLQFYVRTGSGFILSPDAGPSVWNNQWHHIAGTYDGSTVRLYVDGVQVGSGTAASGPINYSASADSLTSDLFIGNYPFTTEFPGGNLPFKGLLDEIGIYSRALAPSEIQGIFNAGSAGKNNNVGNGNDGVDIVGPGADNNIIGGTAATARNIISDNAAAGVVVSGAATTGNIVAGNYVGTDANGTAPLGNPGGGVLIEDGAVANTVGGTAAGAGNVVSANGNSSTPIGGVYLIGSGTSGNVVAGNLIGTDRIGTLGLGNKWDGVGIEGGASGNTVGGAAPGARNVISANNAAGVEIDGPASANVIAGNYVGTDVTGAVPLGNAIAGVLFRVGATGNTVGGLTAAARNVVSGNGGDGVLFRDTGTSGNVIAGNFVGTNAAGTGAVPNVLGVEITNSAAGNTVGGAVAGARNLISGNTGYGGGVEIDTGATGNVVAGNYVGTDVTGTQSLSNPIGIFITTTGNTIGGTAAGAGNVIAGNDGTIDHFESGAQVVITQTSLLDQPNDNVVEGNLIGLGATGHAIPGATNAGVFINFGVGNTVGGLTPAARNVISGNLNGVELQAGSANVFAGNYVGTDPGGNSAVGNGAPGSGVVLVNTTSETIGGTTAAARNVISGHTGGNGVYILNPVAANNVVEGNYIGTDSTGTHGIANLVGVYVAGTAGGNTIGGATATPGTGAGNLIADNSNRGVVFFAETVGDTIEGNAIVGNTNGIQVQQDVGIQIGGTNPQDANQISGNGGYGVWLEGTTTSRIEGNLIGTDAGGTFAQGNAIGVQIDTGSNHNTVGGTAAGAGNVLSGNTGEGVDMSGNGTTGNLVEGNYVGTNAAGTAALGNGGIGVRVMGGATGNVIGGPAGAGNVISGNNAGASLESNSNVLAGNLIGTDKTGAVAIGNNNGAPPSGLGHYNVYTSGSSDVIGGIAAGAGNVIAGSSIGVWIQNSTSTGTVLQGNEIGTNLAGTAALGNTIGVILTDGVTHVTIGGTTPAARNVIAGNTGAGVDVNGGSGSGANLIEGNFIGTNAAGNNLGNGGSGVLFIAGAANNSVGGTAQGMANTIAFNGGDGVEVDTGSVGNSIRGNSIHDNMSLGIQLFGTGNNTQPFPFLTSFVPGLPTMVTGTLTVPSAPGKQFTLDFYANSGPAVGAFGQGQVYLGSLVIVTDAVGNAAFIATLSGSSAASQVVSATATDTSGNTSQFAADVGVAGYSNTNPNVSINGPANVVVGAPVSLASTITDATKNKTYTYAWSVTQPANPAFTLPAATITGEPTLVFVPPTPGTYVASLLVKDNLGGSNTASLTLVAHVPGPAVAIQGAPGAPIAASTLVSLTSSVAEPTGATPVSYAWAVTIDNGQPYSLPSGTVTNTPSFSFTPTANGLYQISLTVLDSAGAAGSTSVFVVVAGSGQVAAIYGVPSSGLEGTPLSVKGAGNPSLTPPYSYNWAVYKNGAVAPFFTAPHDTTGTFAFTPDAPGAYQITLVVTDSQNRTAAAVPVTVPVAAGAPTAQILTFPTSATIGQPVTLSGNGTAVSPADPVSTLTWTVTSGDGKVTATGAGATFTYTPSVVGTDVVQLTALDAVGARGTATVSIPVATATTLTVAASTAKPLLEGTLSELTAIVHNPHAGSYNFAWSVIELANHSSVSGTQTDTSPTSAFDFTPPVPGAYLANVTATNTTDHSTVSFGPATFQAANVPPTIQSINVAPSAVFEGTPVTLTAATADPGQPIDVLHYNWNVTGPDGFKLHGALSALNFTPNESGSYAVTLVVSDSSGAHSATASSTFSVGHVAPTLVIQTAPGTGINTNTGTLTANLNAVLLNDPGNDEAARATAASYAWSVLDQTTNTTSAFSGAGISFAGPASDLFLVTLQFTDDDSATPLTAVAPILVAPVGTTIVTAGNLPAGATQLLIFTQGHSRLDATGFSGTLTAAAVGAGHDTILAGSGPSILVGDSGFNSLVGGSGPDTLIATHDDTLLGGSGTNLFALQPGSGEVVQASSLSTGNTLNFAPSGMGVMVTLGANPTAQFGAGVGAMPVALSGTFQSLIGGTGNDTLISGGASNVYIQAGSGNSQLTANGGSSVTLFGGTGSDTLSSTGGSSVSLVGGAGNSSLSSSGGSSVTMFGGTGNDTLSSTGGSNITLVGGGGNTTLTSSGGSSVTMFGGTGNDTLSSTGGTGVSLVAGPGNDSLSSSGGSSVTMFGGTGNDTLSSTGGTTVTLVGGGGNESLSSSGGTSVTMFGGTGNDTLSSTGGTTVSMVSGNGNDTLSSSGGSSVTMFGGTGNDSLSSSGDSAVSMVSGGGNTTLSSSGGSSVTMFGGTGNDTLSSTGGTNVTLVGGGGNESLSSSGGSSVTMFGGTGNDTLSSTGGTDVSMVGGNGNTTLSSSGGSSVTMFGGTGNDTLSSTGGTNVTLVAGPGNDSLSSSGGSSVTMFGGTGNDTLSSTGGSNVTLVGGNGNTTLSSSGGTSVTMFGGTGNDSLSSTNGTSVSMVSGGGNTTLSSSGGSSVTMFGGTGNDTLSSTGGTDVTLVGGSGNESLSSSGGSSVTMFGGTGNDTLSSSGGTSVSMVGGSGNTTMSSSGGSSVTMFGGTGSDSLSSAGGSSVTIVGGTGNDTLTATNGSNVLLQGAVVVVTQGSGSTSVTMFGGTGNDSLSSTGGSNITLVGGSGNATLSSSGGTSVTMFGGTGNDTLSSTGGTSVSIVGGSGNDTLTSSNGTSVTMFGGTGNDTLSSTAGTTVTIVGGSGNDSLANSGGSSVTMFGGTGNDSLSSTGGTNVSVAGGTGNDTVTSTGGSSVTLFGGTGNDSLASSGGTNVLVQGGPGIVSITTNGSISVTVIAGGNDTLTSSGGTSVTMFGGTGNDSMSSSSNTSATVLGGTGNDTLTNTGGSSVTMFGGTGNDSLSTSGGSSVSVTGGSGNDTLTSTGGTDVTLQGGGSGNDSLSSSGGTSVTMFGGGGNDTLGASGGASVGLYGLEGNNVYNITGPISVALNDLGTFGQQLAQTDSQTAGINTIAFPGLSGLQPGQRGIHLDLSNTSPGPMPQLSTDPGQPQTVAPGITLSLTGQFQNVIGTPGDDWIHGDASSNVLDGGGTGFDTLVGGSGPATLVAGSGNDTLVAGTGGTTFQFAGNSGNILVDPPAGGGANVLDFSRFVTGVSVNLALANAQQVAGPSGLSLTLQTPGEINSFVDSAYADRVTGNASGDTFFVGKGNDTFTGGGGADSFFFNGSQLGIDTINETTTSNTLNFRGFAGPIRLDLTKPAGTQTLNQSAATSLELTLSNPSAFAVIVGSPYGGSITGNNNVSETIIGGGGLATLKAGNGNDYIQNYVTQVVWLDFPAQTPPGDHVYTPAEQLGVLQGLQQKYAGLNYSFTLSQASAAQQAQITGGSYVTLMFNQGNAGGASNQLDPGNLSLGGTTLININPFLGDASLGLVPPTSANIVGLTTTISAHELGHQSGLQHQNAFGPIGTSGTPTGIYTGVQTTEFLPTFPGPSDATATPFDVMASPASVGTTLLDAAGANGPTYFGERDAIGLAFNRYGTVVQQANLPTQQAVTAVNTIPVNAVVLPDPGTIYQVGSLPSLAVPNMAPAGAPGTGQTFDVTAEAVNATVTPGQGVQYYAINGTAGQVMTFEIISNNDTLNPKPVLIPALEVLESSGTIVPYYGNIIDGAFNIHEFESNDSTLIDVVLPATGTYYVGVLDVLSVPAASYQLFMYSFATSTGPNGVTGDVLVAGPGNDTLVGTQGVDQFVNFTGTVVNTNASATTTTLLPPAAPSVYGQSFNLTGVVTAVNGGTPTGSVQFLDTTTGQVLGTVPLQVVGGVDQAMLSAGSGSTLLGAGSHVIEAIYVSADTTAFAGSNSLDSGTNATQVVNRATPTVSVSDAGGSYDGNTFPATATVTGISGIAASTLENVTPTLTYYSGSSATGTPLPAPSAAGTYTVVAFFPGSADYTSASASTTFAIEVALAGTPSAYILSPSAAGALSLSGSAQLNLTGPVNVESSSTSAVSVSGNAQLSAVSIKVVGGVSKSGNAQLSPTPITGAPTFADPLASLVAPDPTRYGLTSKAPVNVSGNDSLGIGPGIYSQISVSGNGKLTMSPGIYVIAGGGFSVTGNSSVSGSGTGVMIYNAGSNYPSAGGTFGVVNLSGSGSISFQPATTGDYAGILVFQSRDNKSTMALSGNGTAIPGGVIYAPSAAVTMSGGGQFKGSLVANTLTLSGTTVAQLTAGNGGGTVYSPDQVRTAYGINGLALDGTGQTIAVVDAYHNPDIYQALDAFDAQFAPKTNGTTLDQLYGPASSFLTVLNQRGDATALPATDPAGPGNDNWEVEEALDVEWAHAVAPGAHIILLEAKSQSLSDLMTAVATAAEQPGVSVVSMSWGFLEGINVLAQDEAAYDGYLTTPAGHTGVTFVASTGDYGAAVPLYPAMSPNVVAVGGTSLTLNADNSYKSEVGWGSYSSSLGLFLGSGGGLSQYEAEPSYQQGIQSTGSRTTPDVSLLADPAKGAWVADPYNLGSDSPWEVVGGTSLSAPAWAGLLALADQGRVTAGKPTLGTAGPTEAQTALYGLRASDYHDITTGSNGYSAGPGYDLMSGLGSPVADLLVPDLVAFSGGTPSSTPVAPITPAGLVLSPEVGSVSGAVDALARAAALRVFSAQPAAGRAVDDVPVVVTAAAMARSAAADAGRAKSASVDLPAPVSVGPPVEAFAKASPDVAVSIPVEIGAEAPVGSGIGLPTSVSGIPTWSAVLLDASSAIGSIPAHVAAALRPEMPADGGIDVLLGGKGDDLLIGGEGRNLLVGGYAATRLQDGTGERLAVRSTDDYFIQLGNDELTGDTNGLICDEK